MGKDTRAGRNSSHHIQLALFPRYIACMDRRGHHLFQGTLQVPLPYSLFSRGTGHHSVHTEFSGLLKSDDMEHARNLSLQHKGAVRERAALFVSVTTGNDTGRKGKGLKTQTLANRELQGKVGKRFLSDGKVRPQAVSEKIILAALRYFSRKPCLSGSVCRWALVVQRAAKARVFTLKNKEYATSDHHQTVTSSDRDARDKKTESTRPATGNQAATKGNHRSRSHLKAAEPRSGNLQTSGQEQAAGRILQRILKHIV